MKDQFSSFFESAKAAGNILKEKAAGISQATIDNIVAAIEKWLEEFPKIESYGLQVRTFSFTMGLSPSLEVEMMGATADFPMDRINQIIQENKAGSLTSMLFNAVKITYKLHGKVAPKLEDPLIIKIRLALSPEISVFIGRPRINS